MRTNWNRATQPTLEVDCLNALHIGILAWWITDLSYDRMVTSDVIVKCYPDLFTCDRGINIVA
jgi:hypothetical protein